MSGRGDERRWEARVRALRDRQRRAAEGTCVVEGIRAVLCAEEAGLAFEAVLTCPQRLQSEVALAFVARAAARGVPVASLSPERFARISDMENPVGLAALVRWAPRGLAALPAPPEALVLIAEDVGDPGNLGSLLRTADAAGASAVVVAGGGTDPGHRRCLRASLGAAFLLPVATAADGLEAVAWAHGNGMLVVATSARAAADYLQAPYRLPLAVVVGNEERGLSPATRAACDLDVRIPMRGRATSLNVAVAAGVVLFELRRRLG